MVDNKRTATHLVSKLKDKLSHNPSLEEKLLLKYFEDNVDMLPVEYGCPEGFHKAFRQVDVCKKGYQDMIIWSILSGGDSERIWEVIEEFFS